MKIRGIVTAMATPLDGNGINVDVTKKLVRHLIDSGVHGLFVLGTNGEFYALREEEKIDLVRTVVDEANGEVPVFAGAGGISTEQVIKLSNDFAKLGVDAVSVITPYLVKLSDREVLAHYTTIADQVDVPLILYNIPANTGINISEAVYTKLLKHRNIIGIKDSSGNIENLKMYIDKNNREDFSVLVGSDSKILTALKMGADGAVAATSNVLTKTDLSIYDYFRNNQVAEAQRAQESIEEFRRILKCSTVPSVLKYSLHAIGYEVGKPVQPVLPVPADYHDEIKSVLEEYRKIEGF